jgi:RNA polymerase sigma-70 factor (ECF subfamily)
MIDADARSAHRELEVRLRPFVARRVSEPDVDDVLQDVFLRMQRGLVDLRDQDRFGPWLYRVARSAIGDHRRMRARHPLADGEPPEGAVDTPDSDADSTVEHALSLAVTPFIAMLPEPYREALTLTELEGKTQREAALTLGVSLSGMKSRVQRGRERLRRMLEDCCEIALDVRGRVVACAPREGGRRPGPCCGS